MSSPPNKSPAGKPKRGNQKAATPEMASPPSRVTPSKVWLKPKRSAVPSAGVCIKKAKTSSDKEGITITVNSETTSVVVTTKDSSIIHLFPCEVKSHDIVVATRNCWGNAAFQHPFFKFVQEQIDTDFCKFKLGVDLATWEVSATDPGYYLEDEPRRSRKSDDESNDRKLRPRYCIYACVVATENHSKNTPEARARLASNLAALNNKPAMQSMYPGSRPNTMQFGGDITPSGDLPPLSTFLTLQDTIAFIRKAYQQYDKETKQMVGPDLDDILASDDILEQYFKAEHIPLVRERYGYTEGGATESAEAATPESLFCIPDFSL